MSFTPLGTNYVSIDDYVSVPWKASTALKLGVVVEPVPANGHTYKVTAAGTTGASQPSWPTTAGATVTNGGVTFKESGAPTRDATALDAAVAGAVAKGKNTNYPTEDGSSGGTYVVWIPYNTARHLILTGWSPGQSNLTLVIDAGQPTRCPWGQVGSTGSSMFIFGSGSDTGFRARVGDTTTGPQTGRGAHRWLVNLDGKQYQTNSSHVYKNLGEFEFGVANWSDPRAHYTHFSDCHVIGNNDTDNASAPQPYTPTIPYFHAAKTAPSQIRMTNVSCEKSPYGFGLTGWNGVDNLTMTNCAAWEGGVCVRGEVLHGGKMTNVTIRGVYQSRGKAVVSLQPHGSNPVGGTFYGIKNVSIAGVYSDENETALTIHATSSDGTGTITGVTIDSTWYVQPGTHAQLGFNRQSLSASYNYGKTATTVDFDTAAANVFGLPGSGKANIIKTGLSNGAAGDYSGTSGHVTFGTFSMPDPITVDLSAPPSSTEQDNAGTLTPAGALNIARPPPQANAGTLTPAGALTIAGNAATVDAGTLTPAGALTITKRTDLIVPESDAGTLAPSGSLVIEKPDVPPPPPATPTFKRTPDVDSTSGVAFFLADSTVPGDWHWSLNGGPEQVGALGTPQDWRTFEVKRGSQHVEARLVPTDGGIPPLDPAVYDWVVSDLVTPVPGPTDLLGCGRYTVYLKHRGGATVGALPATSIDWGRVDGETSEATIIVDGVSNFGSDCCALAGLVEPWAYEIAIYRDDAQQWVGPVVQVGFGADQLKVTARDMTAWLDHRRLPALTLTGSDVSTVADALVNAALRRGNGMAMTHRIISPAGIMLDYAIAAEQALAGAELRKLIDSGLHFTAWKRAVLIGWQPATAGVNARLVDEAFQADPAILGDGLLMTNDSVHVGQSNDAGLAMIGSDSDPASIPVYGLLQSVASSMDDADASALAAAARQDVAYGSVTPWTVSDGTLAQSAPVTIDKLVPGALLDLRLTKQCRPILRTYRLTSMKASATHDGETVTISVEPA